ncbi:hypothetical protein JAAARDRAFT_101904, partial [Jaapia argillacea MUCL 33604]
LNLGRKCASLMQRQQTSRSLLMAVARGDIPRIQQLIRQAMKEGVGLSTIISRLEDSLLGNYQARGYGHVDSDMAVLISRLGGRKLLYALNHYIAIPSITTLRRNRTFTRIMPSLGIPTAEEIQFNMREIFLQRAQALEPIRLPRRGMSVFWDEVSQEEQACYFPHVDAAGGFCRKHGPSVPMQLTTLESAELIAKALADGRIHYGKEASVIALGSFGTELRGAFPIVVSLTCKSETPEESAQILTTVISSWNQVGAPLYGPIWSIASDGDAGRQAMVFFLLMKYTIDPLHPLYKRLGGLPGLNMYVGDGDITADFDWKHEIKHSSASIPCLGMLVGDTIINRHTWIRHLCRTGHHSEHEIDVLMNPADAQDVPRAIELVQAIREIGGIDANPSILQEVKVIRVIAEMFSSFVHAFIGRCDLSPARCWSLKEQLTALSKYAHMAFILFRKYRSNLMPAQLYSDMQTTVKNAFFCVAKQQEEDGNEDIYLFWMGDDRLEVLFGRLRMQGGHNPNFNFKQLVDRLGAAVDIDAVLARNPHLDAGHRRLKVTRMEKLDHLNPESWDGEARANTAVLESVWFAGRAEALHALSTIGLDADLGTIFDATRHVDMLKPFG